MTKRRRAGNTPKREADERRQAEERAVYLASFPELNPNPLFEVGIDGTVVYANPAAERIFPDLKALGAGHPVLEGFGELVEKFGRGKSSDVRDVKFNDASYQQAIHFLPDKKAIRFYCLDITERKRLEETLKDRERQLESRLGAILSPGEASDRTIAEVVDLPSLQDMTDAFYGMTGVGIWLLDLKGNVLVGAGWQDICTKFHRRHPETCKNCVESDLHLSGSVKEGEYVLYRCKNGMWDVITPVVVKGRHIANLYSGQFFFDDEAPDYGYFARQADRYGFDRDDYLAALDRAPRLSREKVKRVLGLYTRFAGLISQLSYNNFELAQLLIKQRASEQALQVKQEELETQAEELESQNEELTTNNEALRRITKSLEESEERLRLSLDSSDAGMWEWDLRTNRNVWSTEIWRLYGLKPHC